ncbi:MAG: peptidyl-prolyl cis-trans isomerase [Holosporales bacterium]|nr:peptidyl-prolyl cis-trans isomerase [Holosporales bacterium]
MFKGALFTAELVVMCFLFSGLADSFSFFKSEKDTTESESNTKDRANADSDKSVEKPNLKGEDGKKKTTKDGGPGGKHPASKDKEKVVVEFKDGSVITEGETKEEINNVPEQLAARMSLADIRNIVAWRMACNKVLKDAAKKSGIMNDPSVKKVVESRIDSAAGILLLDQLTNEEMTFEKAKEHYYATWDKNFKNTMEFELIAITTTDLAVVQKLKRERLDEKAMKAMLDGHSGTTKYMVLDRRPQSMFPPEIAAAVLAAEKGTIIGPFETRGTYMLFFLKEKSPAKRQPFTMEFYNTYKETARRDIINPILEGLYKKYAVKTFDVSGNPVDLFKIGEDDNKDGKSGKGKKGKKNQINLTQVKDSTVLAVVTNGGKKEDVTVHDLKQFFMVDSLTSEPLRAMAAQFNISNEDVVKHAAKIVIDDKILKWEVEARKFYQEPDAKVKLSRIKDLEIAQQLLMKNAKATSESTKSAYNKFIQSIPEEDKNDNEIAIKLIFFPTHEGASQALQSILTGAEKFGNLFKTALGRKTAIDLGYVKRRGMPPELWKLIKSGAPGACCREVVEVNGQQFGVRDCQFAVIYVADRRPVLLPSLANPQDKKYFQAMAEREAAVKFVKKLALAGISSVNGRSVEKWFVNPEFVDRIIAMIIGTPG